VTDKRMTVVTVLLVAALGAALYRWSEADTVAPAAISTLAKYVLYEGTDPARVSFRFAIGVAVSGMEDGDEVEVQFENPADSARTLAGSVMQKPGVPPGQLMFVSPELAGLQCRVYDVSVTLYRARGHEPVATRREKIRSTLDAAAVAAGGSEAMQRAQKGEAVCGG